MRRFNFDAELQFRYFTGLSVKIGCMIVSNERYETVTATARKPEQLRLCHIKEQSCSFAGFYKAIFKWGAQTPPAELKWGGGAFGIKTVTKIGQITINTTKNFSHLRRSMEGLELHSCGMGRGFDYQTPHVYKKMGVCRTPYRHTARAIAVENRFVCPFI